MDRLERFRGVLIELRARLSDTIGEIGEAIVQDVRAPGDISNAPTHPADMDVEGLDRNLALARNESQILADVEGALKRIEQGQFGICQRCGQEVGEERLEALPYTPYCIRCAQAAESEGPAASPAPAPRGPATPP